MWSVPADSIDGKTVSLDEQVQKLLGNADKGLKIGDKSIRISKILNWFGKDFKPAGGVDVLIRCYPSRKALTTTGT